MPKKTLLAVLTAFICSVWPALALTHLNDNELLLKADTVVVGEAISVDQGVQTTRTQVRLLQVLKGAEKPGDLVTVETEGGKVYVDESAPVFATLQTNLLYLQKTPDGLYTCVNQADGQKIIRGRNIYPYHDNVSYSVPLKDYLKGLETALKTGKPLGQADRP